MRTNRFLFAFRGKLRWKVTEIDEREGKQEFDDGNLSLWVNLRFMSRVLYCFSHFLALTLAWSCRGDLMGGVNFFPPCLALPERHGRAGSAHIQMLFLGPTLYS